MAKEVPQKPLEDHWRNKIIKKILKSWGKYSANGAHADKATDKSRRMKKDRQKALE